MPITLSTKTGSPQFNNAFNQRPIWAMVSSTGGSSTALVSYYGKNPYQPLRTPALAYSGFYTEALNSNFGFGAGSASVSTGGFSPSTNGWGISCFRNTSCWNNMRFTDDGVASEYDASKSHIHSMNAGMVIGEKNFHQTYDLMLTRTGRVYKTPLFSTSLDIGTTADFVDFGAIGGNKTDISNVYGFGQICHNRRSRKLLIARPISGSNGVSVAFKLYLIDLQMVIGATTSIAEIRSAVTAAISAGSSRYLEATLSFSDTAVAYSAGTGYSSNDWSKFVLCDDDSVWLMTTGGAGANVLFKATRSGNTYTTAKVDVGTGTRNAPSDVNWINGPAHTVSDDNSVVAVYQPYYSGWGGATIYLLATTSVTTGYQRVSEESTDNISIAPAGGPSFIMTKAVNVDSTAGPTFCFLPGAVMSTTAYNPVWLNGMHPALSASTNLTGFMAVKVQPTVEFYG